MAVVRILIITVTAIATVVSVALIVWTTWQWHISKVEPADSPIVRSFIEATELVPQYAEFPIENSDWHQVTNAELVTDDLDEAGFRCGSNGFTCQRAWFTVSGPCFWFVTITVNESLLATNLDGSWEGTCRWLR